MKRILFFIAILTSLSGNPVFGGETAGKHQVGMGAQAGSSSAADTLAWGAGVGALAILGSLVGAAASGSSQSSNFSH